MTLTSESWRSANRPRSNKRSSARRSTALALLGAGIVIASALIPLGAPQSAHADPATTYYVAPNGKDAGHCSESMPCTLERAQHVVQPAAKRGDVTVQLADGTYRLSEPLRFDAESDGGDHTISWTAAADAHPIITGASQVTGWSQSDVGDGVWVANSPAGLDTRQLYVNGVIAPRASIRLNNADVTPTATGLTINNPALAYLATLPDQGRIEFESLGDFTNRYSPVQSISESEITMAQPAWDNNTWGWDTVQNSFLAGPSWYLDNSLSFLTQVGQWYIDPSAGKLYYKPAEGVDPNKLDIELPQLQSLISIGGTYDNPVTGLAFSGIQFSGTSWLGPSTDGYADQQNGLFIKGAYDYRPADAFTSCSRGCEMFERARTSWFQEPAAVQVSAASRISFTGNTFTNLGQSALGIGNDANATVTGVGLGASDINVVGNRFMEDSGHGIAVGGVLPDAHHPSDPRMTNQNILIENNTVDRVSVDYKDNSGILSTYVTNARILHNEVSNVPYDGIDTGYGWGINDAGGSNDYVDRGYYNWNTKYTTPTTLKDNRIEGNLVHNTKARFADGGSVYNLSASPGTVVDKNYLFNISGVGLYLDEGSRSMTYENNVVQGGGFVFTNAYSLRNNTSDNVIQNNWYNGGGASAPNAAAHNNKLINNVKVNGAAWPAGAQEVICASGVAPEYRTSLNANQFGFSGCPTDAPVSSDFGTAGSSAVSSVFRQDGGAFGIAAAGADVWGSGGQRDDQFGSIYRAGSFGDAASVSARVVSVNDANAWAKSGVMVRNDITKSGASAGYAVVAVTARNGVVFEWDANGDGYLDTDARANVDIYRPIWVQLSRSGTSYTASYSYDGANYVAIGSPVTLDSAAGTQDAGIFSTSHDVSQSAINQFDSLAVTAG
ncbi:MAG TPA: right-handed parallel beta-helix repeat-containing protein [Microbacteriaceae bacterium]|nr:right-handed parallel beta-helix repeat-containing protein [Microbacteriaceae bacterium]